MENFLKLRIIKILLIYRALRPTFATVSLLIDIMGDNLCSQSWVFDFHILLNVFTFGGVKRSGSDRECKYFPIGMNAREPLRR